MMEENLLSMYFWDDMFIPTESRKEMRGYSLSRADYIELLSNKYFSMDEIKNGCIWLGAENTDYLLTWAEVDELPDLVQQDTKIYEYNQGTTPHCTLYSAFGAVSDLFNYEFTQKEIDEMVEESYNRGRIKWEWWYVKSAVNLVADYWNEHHSNLGRVVYYRVSLDDTETVDKILKKNYTLCSWYNGNKKYNADRDDDCILNWVSFWKSTYGHAVSWIGRYGARMIKDNYKWRKTNIYGVEHEPKELVKSWCYFSNAYLFTKVDNLEEIKRLNEFKTIIIQAIELNSSLRHFTNSQTYKNSLHNMNNENRKKLEDIEKELKKYE